MTETVSHELLYEIVIQREITIAMGSVSREDLLQGLQDNEECFWSTGLTDENGRLWTVHKQHGLSITQMSKDSPFFVFRTVDISTKERQTVLKSSKDPRSSLRRRFRKQIYQARAFTDDRGQRWSLREENKGPEMVHYEQL